MADAVQDDKEYYMSYDRIKFRVTASNKSVIYDVGASEFDIIRDASDNPVAISITTIPMLSDGIRFETPISYTGLDMLEIHRAVAKVPDYEPGTVPAGNCVFGTPDENGNFVPLPDENATPEPTAAPQQFLTAEQMVNVNGN